MSKLRSYSTAQQATLHVVATSGWRQVLFLFIVALALARTCSDGNANSKHSVEGHARLGGYWRNVDAIYVLMQQLRPPLLLVLLVLLLRQVLMLLLLLRLLLIIGLSHVRALRLGIWAWVLVVGWGIGVWAWRLALRV